MHDNDDLYTYVAIVKEFKKINYIRRTLGF